MEVVSGFGMVDSAHTLTVATPSFTLSEPKAHTYSEMFASVQAISSGLRHLGLGKSTTGKDVPDEDEDGRERAAVYAETRWVVGKRHGTDDKLMRGL